MKLVLFGIQGSGKSTQGSLLSRYLKVPYLSTGHIFRTIAKEKTLLGKKVKIIMTSGMLVPDNLTIEIVNDYLSRPEYQRGYILDGFPRTLNQAKRFKNGVDKVIYLEIPDKEALWRLASRDDADQGREDNTVKAIKRRIEVFHKLTEPVLNYYEKEGKFVVIDGLQKIKAVNEEILKSLGKQLVKNQIRSWSLRKKILLAIVGLPGAGKTAAANYFKERNGSVIEFGKIINNYIDKHHLRHSENNHRKLREKFREKYGREAFAILNEKKIKKAFLKDKVVIVDGLRSWEEYVYLKKKLKRIKIVLVALYADKELRYERITKRSYRNELCGEKRDIDELIGINMAPTLGFADYFVRANGSIEDLEDKLEVIFRIVYYS